MIMPTKRLPSNKSLVFVGAQILALVQEPKTVSRLWEETKNLRQSTTAEYAITYSWFVLALDLLYTIGAIELLETGLIRRRNDDL